MYIWKLTGWKWSCVLESLEKAPATGVVIIFFGGGKRMGITKMGKTIVACHSRLGLGSSIVIHSGIYPGVVRVLWAPHQNKGQ